MAKTKNKAKTRPKAETQLQTVLDLQVQIMVPSSAVPFLAADHTIVGFKLPNGSIVRPLLTLEVETPKNQYRCLTSDKAMRKLGFEVVNYTESEFSPPEAD